jgi:7,8-dihydropterin-6-yl-methyl-4-(beta-D-ribofuranosyl)aminobenzene 5'-phosphate synthase
MYRSKNKIIGKIVLFLFLTNVVIVGYTSYIFFNPSIGPSQDEGSIIRTQILSDLGEVESLDLTVVADNYPNGDLSALWGVSILIETNNSTVLLDTGQSYSVLRGNALALNKNLSNVDFVVISHEHWDHIGGLSYIEEVNPGVTVYVPSLMDTQTFNDINQTNLNVIKINETTIIQPGFAIIGELNGPPYEQALVVNVEEVGLVSFVGCSHPGVENIIEKATNDIGIDTYMVIGGFHMGGATVQQIEDTVDRLIDLGVNRIYPIHCCGDLIRSYMAVNYPQYYGRGNVGFQKTINANTINPTEPPPIFLYILIPVLIGSVSVVIGWFVRKNILKKRT